MSLRAFGRIAMAALLGAASGCTGSNAPTTQPEGAIGITATPTTGEAVVWPDEEFRYSKPQPGPPAELSIPEVETFTLDSGLQVFLASRDELPTVSAWLSFPSGSIADPEGKRGRTSVCMGLMGQGTTKLDKVAFEEKQADLASNVWARSGRESVSTGISTLRRTLEPTLDLWEQMLREPGLRQGDLDRILAARKASLAQNKSAPRNLGSRLWPTVIMGPTHPYGRITTERDYTSITRKDCQKFHGALGVGNAKLFIAGAITRAEVETLIAPRLSSLEGKTPEPAVPPAATPRPAGVYFADIPGAAQSQIYVGHPGPLRTAPDYEANRLVAAILGGSFSGRVNMNIREDKGYAYGARAGFSYSKHVGTFAMSTSVRSDATAPALTELLFELARMHDEPVTLEELEREQDAAIASLPAMFSTSSRLLRTYSSLVFYGLPLDYYDGFIGRIESLGIADLRTASRTNLQTTDLSILVVGDGETVLPSLKTFAKERGLGKVSVLDGDGKRR